MPFEILLTFFAASIAIELTPGPNMAYLAILSAQRGRVAGYAAVAGVALGLLVIGLLAAYGVAALIEANRLIYQVLRWGGVMYLIWLGWDIWRDAQLPPETADLDRPLSTYFSRGLITNLLNPKAALFYVTVLPGFVDEGQALLRQTVTLTLVYVFAATLVHALIVSAAGSFTWVFEHQRFRRWIGLLFGLLMVGVAIWLAFKTA